MDGKNEKPTAAQLFQFWASRLEGAVADAPLLKAYAGRQVGESCAGLVPCAEGLSCHPGVLKCFSVPRWKDEACILGGPFDCDVTMQCASPKQVCKTVDDRTNGAYCDGFTYQCAQGYHCQFQGVIPIAQTGRCVYGSATATNVYDWPPQPSAPLLHPYSRSDSEGDPLFRTSAWRIFEQCTPSQLVVGLTVATRYFASVDTVRGRRFGWTTLRNITPICVDTNKDLGWAGSPLNEQPEAPFVRSTFRSTCCRRALDTTGDGWSTTPMERFRPFWPIRASLSNFSPLLWRSPPRVRAMLPQSGSRRGDRLETKLSRCRPLGPALRCLSRFQTMDCQGPRCCSSRAHVRLRATGGGS